MSREGIKGTGTKKKEILPGKITHILHVYLVKVGTWTKASMAASDLCSIRR